MLAKWRSCDTYYLVDAFQDSADGKRPGADRRDFVLGAEAGVLWPFLDKGQAMHALPPLAAGDGPHASTVSSSSFSSSSVLLAKQLASSWSFSSWSSSLAGTTTATPRADGAAAPVGNALEVIPDGAAAFVYLDPPDPSYDSIKRHLQLWWPKVKSGREGGDEGGEKHKGGILAGHDYTAARAGVPLAVNEFADARGLKLRLTGVQRPRRDVRGNQIPPCCPSWYIEKP